MTSLKDLKADWLKDPAVRADYDALAAEFALAEALVRARAAANLTQAELALRMKTSQSYIAKLESGRVSPSMKALQRYATATGATLRISLDRAA